MAPCLWFELVKLIKMIILLSHHRVCHLFIWFTILANRFDYANTCPCHFTQVHPSHLHSVPSLHYYRSLYHCTGPLPSCAITVNTTVYVRFFQVTPIHVEIAVLQEKQTWRLSVGKSCMILLGSQDEDWCIKDISNYSKKKRLILFYHD